MAARRCSLCGISYPGEWKFNICPLHQQRNDYIENAVPDEDWQFKLLRLAEHLELAETEPPDIPVVEARVVVRDGVFFIHAWDVYDAVRRKLRDGDLVMVGKQAFEIVGYIEKTREYVVRPFSLTLSDEDLANLAGP